MLQGRTLEQVQRDSFGLLPEVATDSSTITRDTLPPFYSQYYEGGGEKRIYFNINNSISSLVLDYVATNTTAKYYVGVLTNRAFETASGDASYTGTGFTPKAVIIFCCVPGVDNTISWGFSDGVRNGCATQDYNLHWQSDTLVTVIYLYEAAGKSQSAVVKSFDSNGFTLTWSRNGVTTAIGNMGGFYLAIG